jgi:ribosomal protein L11 methyltransferase
LQATADNAAVNGVELDVRRFDLRTEEVPAAGTVTANLLGPLLRAWAPRLAAAPARLIASGLLVAEADGIAEAFAAAGLREADRRESGEWGALLLERA